MSEILQNSGIKIYFVCAKQRRLCGAVLSCLFVPIRAPPRSGFVPMQRAYGGVERLGDLIILEDRKHYAVLVLCHAIKEQLISALGLSPFLGCAVLVSLSERSLNTVEIHMT